MTSTSSYPPLRLLIAGEWRGAEGRDTEPVFNPATGLVLGALPHAQERDLDDALEGAERAAAPWAAVSPLDRSGILRRAAQTLRERRDAIATLITLELGKPLTEALVEVDTAAAIIGWNAEEARRSYGRMIPARAGGIRQMVQREPLGPIAGFAPWNAPAITPAGKISGALAAGCPMVFKPSEETPATGLEIARAFIDAGLPPGVLSVVFGDPAVISAHLLRSPVIRGVTFTGSTAVGKHLAGLAVQSLKRMTLELGGHAPVLVWSDVDIDRVADAAVAAKYRNAGQVCTSPTRFYVHGAVYDRFLARFAAGAAALKVGDGFAAGVQMGPLANPRRVAAMQDMVDDARSRQIRVATGGRPIAGPGNFVQPIVLADADDACMAANTEPFGPLAVFRSVSSAEEAIAAANRLPVGLAGYVMAREGAVANRLANAMQCGSVAINHWQVSLPETPFGGVKESGYGQEGGIEGLQAFETLKYISQI